MSKDLVIDQYPPKDSDGYTMDGAYFFGEKEGAVMDRMPRYELYHRIAQAYQLAGALLIGGTVVDQESFRRINGWSDEEIDTAIIALLDFLSLPSTVSVERLREASAISRDVSPDEVV